MTATSRRVAAGAGLVVALGLGLASPAARALTDPMRPIVPPAGAPAGGSPSTPAPVAPPPDRPWTPAPGVGEPDRPAANPLRATRRGADGRWQALLDTRWVQAGDRLDDARVVEVSADRVVLARGQSRDTLHLLPALGPVQTPWPATAPPARAGARP